MLNFYFIFRKLVKTFVSAKSI